MPVPVPFAFRVSIPFVVECDEAPLKMRHTRGADVFSFFFFLFGQLFCRQTVTLQKRDENDRLRWFFIQGAAKGGMCMEWYGMVSYRTGTETGLGTGLDASHPRRRLTQRGEGTAQEKHRCEDNV